jgi:hypothetical protein
MATRRWALTSLEAQISRARPGDDDRRVLRGARRGQRLGAGAGPRRGHRLRAGCLAIRVRVAPRVLHLRQPGRPRLDSGRLAGHCRPWRWHSSWSADCSPPGCGTSRPWTPPRADLRSATRHVRKTAWHADPRPARRQYQASAPWIGTALLPHAHPELDGLPAVGSTEQLSCTCAYSAIGVPASAKEPRPRSHGVAGHPAPDWL